MTPFMESETVYIYPSYTITADANEAYFNVIGSLNEVSPDRKL